jgi:hypothetical protein
MRRQNTYIRYSADKTPDMEKLPTCYLHNYQYI